jgi:hypothetical protein
MFHEIAIALSEIWKCPTTCVTSGEASVDNVRRQKNSKTVTNPLVMCPLGWTG